ncbi:MAG: HAD family hydrolase [Polyangiaceae bacterium]|nr:HAD family hydrolase [Polyangiaceae bacterium]
MDHRLGAPGWAGPASDLDVDLVYSVNGETKVELVTVEDLRPEASTELRRLSSRYRLFIASGDRPERVRALAAQAGVPEEQAFGGLEPEEKARFVAAHGPAETLMVGDGLNDAPAFALALASATPSVERPFIASRADFYFLTPGLEAIAQALRGARKLSHSVRLNLALAVAYNAAVVAIALAGMMRPWLAAVLMPASSLATTALTLRLTRLGKDPWKS